MTDKRKPIILLHGLASNRTRWNEFIRESALATSHELIAVDLRGHGEAMTRHAFGLNAWSQDLRALLVARNADRAVLIGHSLGAQAALHFACRFPHQMAGLVLIDPVFREALVPAKQNYVRFGPLFQLCASIIRVLNRIGIHRGALPALDLEALDREARIALKDPAKRDAFVAKYSSTKEDLKYIPHANYLQDVVEMFRPLTPFTSISCPVLVLRSTIAGHQVESIVAKRLAEFPNVSIKMIECHHWPLTEKPAEVQQLIEAWLYERVYA